MPAEEQEETGRGFEFRSSIPVLRMFDEAKAKDFYLDYLGFAVDWEHRFGPSPDSPLYMQIRQGAAIIHLNGHANEDAPVSEVRIPVQGLEDYCEHLRAKESDYPKPSVVDPRYEGRKTDMNVFDPFQNYLVFWAAKEAD